MDATASSGGPITVLPQIVSGSPEQIAKHVGELLKKATEFATLLNEFAGAAKQLEKVWSGNASESALKKIADSLASLTKIIDVVRKGADLLGISGTLVQTAQQAYRSVVAAVNPTVASLMSNPWTYGAAVALSTATSASLKGFIQAIAALLKTLGVVDLAGQISQIATIIGEIEKLFGGGDKGTGSGGAPNNGSVGGTPVTPPQTPPSVASPSGQQVAGNGGLPIGGGTGGLGGTGGGFGGGTGGGIGGTGGGAAPGGFTNYLPPALNGFTGNQGQSPWDWAAGGGGAAGGSLAPGLIDPRNAWIPVDPAANAVPGQTLPAPADTAPVPQQPAPGGGEGDDIVIRTEHGDVATSIEVPMGRDIELDLEFTVDGKEYEQHIDIDADGTVSVDR
ncbi:WXG100 family type VII secretion target [Amycolatopsis magusensis]|uniref:WXG100 family type VII secretion target n=1 Tax=Amycolatopsis magusensis TaxID=882444 RepID=UPI003C2F763A